MEEAIGQVLNDNDFYVAFSAESKGIEEISKRCEKESRLFDSELVIREVDLHQAEIEKIFAQNVGLLSINVFCSEAKRAMDNILKNLTSRREKMIYFPFYVDVGILLLGHCH